MKDALGDRMKTNYEDRTRYMLPRRTYTIIRLDGKSFHTYTKNLNKPFDVGLIEDIDNSIINILPEIQGTVFAYTQSDEISILLTDFNKPETSAWFDGNIQKMSSVTSSMMTAEFNKMRYLRCIWENIWENPIEGGITATEKAYFDCRCFSIPDRVEVMNYFRWRQQDCIRNSVSMVAYANFNQKELDGKSTSDKLEMINQMGINWETDFTNGEKNGRIFLRKDFSEVVSVPNKNNSDNITTEVVRSKWVSEDAWIFTKDEGKLLSMIPKHEE